MARPWIAVGALLVSTAPMAVAQETITPLASISLSQTTGEKPQSKLWFHAGHWWAVLPSTAVSPTGTWVWCLDADNRWRNVLRLSSSTGHVISSAILRLRALTQTDAQSDSKGRVHVSTCGWNEATLTGTTQPQPPIGTLLDAPAGSVAQGQVVDFHVTGAITHGDGTYCLAVDTNSSNAVRYTAREAGAGGPAIRLTASP
jgi:hypothetical protein